MKTTNGIPEYTGSFVSWTTLIFTTCSLISFTVVGCLEAVNPKRRLFQPVERVYALLCSIRSSYSSHIRLPGTVSKTLL